MNEEAPSEVYRWFPLVALTIGHGWVVLTCVSRHGAPDPPALCSAPPVTTLMLLGLAYIELTRRSRLRGAIALATIAIPLVLQIVSEGIN